MKSLLCLCILGALFFSACSKSSSSSTTNSQLLGTWTLTKIATDSNNDGIPEASEWMTATGAITFNSNMTGYHAVVTSTFSDTGSFTYTASSTYVVITDIKSGSSPSGLHIDSLTAHVIQLMDTSNGKKQWYYGTK